MSEHHLKQERTVVLVKPDGVKRGLIGEVIRRLEQRGLKVVAMKMIVASAEQARDHYPNTEAWLTTIGEKSLADYRAMGKDPIAEMGTDDKLAIGKKVSGYNVEFFVSGPLVAMIVEGIDAIAMVRKIVGHTFPSKADTGTIRGDYSVDSPILANADHRAIHNVVHASGDEAEAKHEIQHWFRPEEIHSYKRAEEDIMF